MSITEIIETLEGCGAIIDGILEERKYSRLQAVKAALDACRESLEAIWEKEPSGADG